MGIIQTADGFEIHGCDKQNHKDCQNNDGGDDKQTRLDDIVELIADGQKYKGNPKADALLEKLAAQREALESCEYAGDIIECFQGIRLTDPVENRCRMFAATCKVTYGNTPAQKKMLGQK